MHGCSAWRCCSRSRSTALLGARLAGARATRRTRPPAPCRGVNLHPSASNTRAVNEATLCLVNRVRAAHHLRTLLPNHDLQHVASRQVHSMLRGDYFADDGPSGQTPGRLIGATRYAAHAAALSIGEDIAWGTGSASSPAQIVLALMASPEHRAIILTAKFVEAGVDVMAAVPSVLEVSPPGATYAIEFGARRL